MSGLSAQGFERKRLPDIQQELRQAMRDAFGPINIGPESVFGQLIGIMAEREDQLWQLAEAVYLSQYPASAAARSLDGVSALTGITRLGATRTRVTGVVIGTPATVIPFNSQASTAPQGDVYRTEAAATISASSVLVATLGVAAQNSTLYRVTIGGVNYDYTSGTSQSAATIATALAAVADTSPLATVVAQSDALLIEAADPAEPFTLAVTGPVVILSVGSPVPFVALETGPRQALAGQLSQIETPVSGWTAVTNLVDGVAGRNIETDPELRIRREQSLRVIGAGTVEAIRARILQEVLGVTSVLIVENRTDSEVEGRPAHSFEAIVQGGDQQQIGEVIWRTKPAGIEAHGAIEITVIDSTGVERAVGFSRPEPVAIWVTVELTIEAGFPPDGLARVRDELAAFGAAFQPGQDVIFQALYKAIYRVPGITNADLAVAATDGTAPSPSDYDDENIVVAASEIAVWLPERIEVTLA